MNPRARFRESLLPLLEELTIAPVDAAFRSTGALMEREYIHLDIEEDGSALGNRLRQSGWRPASIESEVSTYHLNDSAVQLILRTGVRRT